MIDELGRTVHMQTPARRIISLCPAITETLFALSLEDNIVGRTRYCIFPAQAATITAVGGTKDINLDAIHALQPDLIICEKEENTKDIVETLAAYYPVYVAQVQTIPEALTMIQKMGALTHCTEQATALQENITRAFTQLPQQHGRAAYMMWRKPYMVVGDTTYIHNVLTRIGFHNPFASFDGRYPAVTIEQLQHAQLDYLFLSSEPFPFRDKHIQELQAHLPHTDIRLIDGEMFWYGAKMVEAAAYLRQFFAKESE